MLGTSSALQRERKVEEAQHNYDALDNLRATYACSRERGRHSTRESTGKPVTVSEGGGQKGREKKKRRRCEESSFMKT